MKPSTARAALLVAALTTAGCFAMPDSPEIPPDAPIELYAPARDLRSIRLDAVLSPADRTLSNAPLTITTHRNVARAVGPAVVNLYTRTRTPVRVRLFPIQSRVGGIRLKLPGHALGSGFFVEPSGLVITNEHVVRDSTAIRGQLADGGDYELEIVATDPAHDIALLRVVNPQRTFEVLGMGSSDQVSAGDHVIALGNPLGLSNSVSAGVIGQTGRNLFGAFPKETRPTDFLQTDAAINPGSSGGPLVTLTGAWVGVNTATLSEAQGIGFAIPSSQVVRFVRAVIRGDGEQR